MIKYLFEYIFSTKESYLLKLSSFDLLGSYREGFDLFPKRILDGNIKFLYLTGVENLNFALNNWKLQSRNLLPTYRFSFLVECYLCPSKNLKIPLFQAKFWKEINIWKLTAFEGNIKSLFFNNIRTIRCFMWKLFSMLLFVKKVRIMPLLDFPLKICTKFDQQLALYFIFAENLLLQ